MQNKYTNNRYKAKQGRLPMFISDSLEITDSVLAFDEIMEEIEIGKYLKPEQTSKISTNPPHHDRHGLTRTKKAVQTPY